jgi:Putative DNA-binding domain
MWQRGELAAAARSVCFGQREIYGGTKMIPKEFDVIGKDDISALVAGAVAEGRTIEYKEQLPRPNDEDTREFLADISSFANSGGGDLIYGIREKRDADNKATGLPEAAEGLSGINADAEIRRIDQMIRSGVEPRIPGFRIKAIDGFTAGPVLLVHVPKSWASPHMITFKNRSRFYSRTSAGKYQLNIGEIRAAFEMTTTLKKTVENFRVERLSKIQALETPVPVIPWPRFVLHLYPFSSGDSSTARDITLRANQIQRIETFFNASALRRFNLEGLVAFCSPYNGTTRGYVQIFRNGVIEGMLNCALIDVDRQPMTPEEKANKRGRLLSAQGIEAYARRGFRHFLDLLKELELEPPIILMMSLVGVKGMELGIDSEFYNFPEAVPFDREIIPLPECIIDSFEIEPDQVLRPMFDVAWQACGQPQSRNYNAEGKWDGGASVMGVV